MKDKSRKRLNICMVLSMIIVMSYQATGNLFHEVAGVLLFILFIAHNILNRKWFQNLSKGSYSEYRKVVLTVNILTLVCMLLTMGTGIYLSQSIFSLFWGKRETYLVRSVHVAAAVWGTILVSFHGGMHIKWAGKGHFFSSIMAVGAVGLGSVSFMVLDMPARLILQDTAKYWRYSGLLLFLCNAAVMAMFALLAAWIANWMKKKKAGG